MKTSIKTRFEKTLREMAEKFPKKFYHFSASGVFEILDKNQVCKYRIIIDEVTQDDCDRLAADFGYIIEVVLVSADTKEKYDHQLTLKSGLLFVETPLFETNTKLESAMMAVINIWEREKSK